MNRSVPHLLDLASERAGGAVLAANDEFFAEKENLIKDAPPLFIPDRFTDRGKWMDGWETRRKREPGHDWAILRLGIPGIVRRIVVDTSHFTGNYPEHCQVEGCVSSGNTPSEELSDWTKILPKSALTGDTQNNFDIVHSERFTHLRLSIFPDGGVARLRLFGEALPDWHGASEIDLAAADQGAAIVDSSDRHYGHPIAMLMPGRATNMGDGWETRRRRGPGHDWAIVRLAGEGIVDRIEIDTNHFKGNYPDRCSIETSQTGDDWRKLLPETKLQPHTMHCFRAESSATGALSTATVLREFLKTSREPARFLRLNIFPDGGISRLRAYGTPTETGRQEMNLKWLNAQSVASARADLIRCCGSSTWAERMIVARPFVHLAQLEEQATEIWRSCSERDWLEAFAAHPEIGRRTTSTWSAQEQAAAASPSREAAHRLARYNLEYRQKHGFIFIVCATGKSVDEMLTIVAERLRNDTSTELRNAAYEQRKITQLRLQRLLNE